MSIQMVSREKLFGKISARLGIARKILKVKFIFEKIGRFIKSENTGVFFCYKYEVPDVHPTFIKRYYGHAPLQYENYSKARLYHWIHHQYIVDNKPFVLEPNDHPLAPACRIEPWENISKIGEVAEIYLNRLCKRIIVDSPGQMDLFKYYYGNNDEIIKKCVIVHGGLIPVKVNWYNKLGRIMSGEINYICLASDFSRKAVDLVLEAWFRYYRSSLKCKLYLACPNIPREFHRRMNQSNVIHITKAPLSERDKTRLHSIADVALAPLHTDGGANINEAMENGLTVVTMRYQRSRGFSMNDNCIVVDVPFNYYDPQYWGVTWKTVDEFFTILDDSKMKGDFEQTVHGFVRTFKEFDDNPEKVYDMCVRAYEYACSDYSIWKRNAILLKIYNEILSSNE